MALLNSSELYKLSFRTTKKIPAQIQPSSDLRSINRSPFPQQERTSPLPSNNLHVRSDIANHKFVLKSEVSPIKAFIEKDHSNSARRRDEVCASQLREKSKAFFKNLIEKVTDLKASFLEYYQGDNIPLLPKRTLVNKVIECLELLKREESEQQELMTVIIKILKATLYVNREVAEEFMTGVQFLDDNDLKKVIKTCQQENIPYYTLCFSVFKELARQGHRRDQLKKDHKIEIDGLKEALREKDRKVEELLQKFSGCVTYEVYENTVKEKDLVLLQCENINTENQKLKSQHKILEVQINELKAQIEQGVQEMRDYVDRTASIVETNEIYLKDIQDYKYLLNEAKVKVKTYKNTMDSVIVKVSDMKLQIENLIKINSQLACENEKLKLRAATAFEHLTPRPNYRKLQKDKKIELDIYDEKKKNQIVSTSRIMDELLSRISQEECDEKSATFTNLKNKKDCNKLESQNNDKETHLKIFITNPNLPEKIEEYIEASKAIDFKEAFRKKAQSTWPYTDPEGNVKMLANTEDCDKLTHFLTKEYESDKITEDSNSSKNYQNVISPPKKEKPRRQNIRQSSNLRRTHSFALRIKNDLTGQDATKSFGKEVLREATELITKIIQDKKKM